MGVVLTAPLQKLVLDCMRVPLLTCTSSWPSICHSKAGEDPPAATAERT